MSEKRFVKGEKKIAGVCSGIANYFGWDPTFVRIGFVCLSLFYGVGFVPYIIAAVVMPNE